MIRKGQRIKVICNEARLKEVGVRQKHIKHILGKIGTVQEMLLIIRASFGNKKAKKELRQREIRDRQKQIIRSRRRQQLLRENQDKNNNWKRIHGLPTTRKKRGKTQQTIEKT